jgi:hypothetical protein
LEAEILGWLQRAGWVAFSMSVAAFVLVNSIGFAILLRRRDRTLVNTWTPRLLAVNILLAGTGLGVPVLTTAARFAIVTVAPTVRMFVAPRPQPETARPTFTVPPGAETSSLR